MELQKELGIKSEQEKEFNEFYDKYEPEAIIIKSGSLKQFAKNCLVLNEVK